MGGGVGRVLIGSVVCGGYCWEIAFGGRALKPPLGGIGWGRKGVAGERGAEMVVWFGGCGDFGRKSP